MIIGKYRTSSTRGKTANMHVVRVRSEQSRILLAEVYPARLDPDTRGHSDPYAFIVKHPASKSQKEFVRQLQEKGVSEADIKLLLQIDYK